MRAAGNAERLRWPIGTEEASGGIVTIGIYGKLTSPKARSNTEEASGGIVTIGIYGKLTSLRHEAMRRLAYGNPPDRPPPTGVHEVSGDLDK